ncbi:hypothetical protein [Larkinella sp.]|uniref:hypothetical protein n=1 Tax=Larkinella sp. TaxID=2034517 RepID=UPI003BAB3A43
MTLQHLTAAMNDCELGNIHFNLNNRISFLYANKWYPLRAVLIAASKRAQGKKELTTDEARKALLGILPQSQIDVVNYSKHLPVPK